MKSFRLLTCVAMLLLSGCLVVFQEPLPSNEPAPVALLAEWTRTNEWGEQLFLNVTRSGATDYKALVTTGSPDNSEGAEEYNFSVARHGRRWYFSVGLPKRFGANFAIGGFEITRSNELVIYSLDAKPFLAEIQSGQLKGEVVSTLYGENALITSPSAQVFAYLNDPANSDVFVEVARYQRSTE